MLLTLQRLTVTQELEGCALLSQQFVLCRRTSRLSGCVKQALKIDVELQFGFEN